MKTRRKPGLRSDWFRNRIASNARWFALCLGISTAACVETQLSSQGAAAPKAALTPLPEVSSALASDFDPLESDASSVPNAAAEHDHGEHSGTAKTESDTGASESNTSSTSEVEKPSSQSFTCPMHPEIVRPAPGKCPICGMKLVPVKPKAEPEAKP